MHELKTVTFDAEQIMEQAQVFASAWSLVGGCFDSGSMLAEAESAKAELRAMIEKALAAAPTTAAQSEFPGVLSDSMKARISELEDLAGAEKICAAALFTQMRHLINAAAERSKSTAQSAGHEAGLPSWWPDFIQNVCELPDRSSPEDEPEAMIATAEELESCALSAIEDAAPVNGGERVEDKFVAIHGHRLALLLGIEAYDIADRDAKIMAVLRAADAQQVDANIRGEVAYQLHTRNRWLDMPTMRAIVDSAFDAAIAKNTLTSPAKEQK
ncbi:hypothetical protein ACNHE5_01080 [Pandoraea pnomenusa]|uniref:hypothetical protein n=1 Tax=Pandoraea pnomenusa TaxID=93220 RepID=UPI003CF1089A